MPHQVDKNSELTQKEPPEEQDPPVEQLPQAEQLRLGTEETERSNLDPERKLRQEAEAEMMPRSSLQRAELGKKPPVVKAAGQTMTGHTSTYKSHSGRFVMGQRSSAGRYYESCTSDGSMPALQLW